MVMTVKTIVKMFLLFFAFQVSINFLIEFVPGNMPTFNAENQAYLDFIQQKTNAQLDGETESRTLLENFQTAIETENLFNDSIIESFLGVLQVIGSLLKFIFQLCLQILFTPTVIMEILLYNFIFSSTILMAISISVNVFFYMTLFYIVFRARTTS